MNKLLFVALCALLCAITNCTITNCATESSNVCSDCDAGYGLSSNACPACSTNSDGCLTCETDALATCLTCDEGYGLKEGTSPAVTCETCSSNCASCAEYDSCDICNAGYGLVTASGKKTCTACSIGNCAYCPAAPGTCTVCKATYFLKDKKCNACAAGCAICTDADTCGMCLDGYAFDSNNKCQVCSNGCTECDEVDDACDACPTNSVPNKTDSVINWCCPLNCTECSSASTCTACKEGVNLNKDKGTCFGFKTGASLTLGAIISVALFSLLF